MLCRLLFLFLSNLSHQCVTMQSASPGQEFFVLKYINYKVSGKGFPCLTSSLSDHQEFNMHSKALSKKVHEAVSSLFRRNIQSTLREHVPLILNWRGHLFKESIFLSPLAPITANILLPSLFYLWTYVQFICYNLQST